MISQNVMKLNVLAVLVGLVTVSSANAMNMDGKELQKKFRETSSRIKKEEEKSLNKQNARKKRQEKDEKETALAHKKSNDKQVDLSKKFREIDAEKPAYTKERVREKTIAEKNKKLRDKDAARKAKKEEKLNKSLPIETSDFVAGDLPVVSSIPTKTKKNTKSLKKVDPNAAYNPNGPQPGGDWIPNHTTR